LLIPGRASEFHAASRGITILGITLSAIFAGVGFHSTQSIGKYDKYLLEKEDNSELANGPFKTILTYRSDIPCIPTLKRWAAGYFLWLKRWAAGLFRVRLSMSWFIPTVFVGFWVPMCIMFWN